jgi:hypothetical protein
MNDGTYRDIRSKFGLTAQISESVIRAVRAKYNAVGKSKAFRHKDPIRFSVPQCDEVYGNDFSFKKDGIVSINSKIGRLKMRYSIKSFERYFDGSWTLGTSKLWSDGNGIFFLIVSLHKEVDDIDPVKSYGVVNIVGIDRGLINLVTAYDSDGKNDVLFRRKAPGLQIQGDESQEEASEARNPVVKTAPSRDRPSREPLHARCQSSRVQGTRCGPSRWDGLRHRGSDRSEVADHGQARIRAL